MNGSRDERGRNRHRIPAEAIAFDEIARMNLLETNSVMTPAMSLEQNADKFNVTKNNDAYDNVTLQSTARYSIRFSPKLP
mmetsp:Transcript_20050/g.20165  ORF Transcript_20050/g.20165 Transcript_20050/m.20165 type:complete len:80 (+) Transcript_20050:94-333(+)